MKIAYFDAPAGMSGDMTVGALLDVGRRRGIGVGGLARALGCLKIDGFHVAGEPVRVNGIEALSFRVVMESQTAPPRDWAMIRRMIEDAMGCGLPEGTAGRSLRVFEALAKAEARVHGVEPERVHFHEVGAIDSIVDIVATCWCLDSLGIESCFAGPLPLGQGVVATAHGRLPLPAPATTVLLEGFDVLVGDGEGEMVTPTGAAILAALARPGRPTFRLEASGTGAGTRRQGDRPNVLRVLVGECDGGADEQAFVIETDIDDMTPEALTFACEQIRDAGALDVTVTATQMKKGRLGMHLTVLSSLLDLDRLADAVLSRTSSIGLRYRVVGRIVLTRRTDVVETDYGSIAVKAVVRPEGRETAEPEYDDVARAALAHGVGLNEVRQAALAAWQRRHRD